ncbi:hypothetical protein [Myxococcus landrumensis]|nr:hypothetical protein [Myxococcus landrumus]
MTPVADESALSNPGIPPTSSQRTTVTGFADDSEREAPTRRTTS